MEKAEIAFFVHVGDHLVWDTVEEDVELAAIEGVELIEIDLLINATVLVMVEGQSDYSAVLIELLVVVAAPVVVGVVCPLLEGIIAGCCAVV